MEDDSKTSAASIAPAIPAWRSIANRRTSVDIDTDLVAHPVIMMLCQTEFPMSPNHKKATNPLTANVANIVRNNVRAACHPIRRRTELRSSCGDFEHSSDLMPARVWSAIKYEKFEDENQDLFQRDSEY